MSALILGAPNASQAANAALSDDKTETDLPYCNEETLAKGNDYPGFPTIVWFHGGGGLTRGQRYLPNLRNQGIGLVAVSYRLSPEADFPASF